MLQKRFGQNEERDTNETELAVETTRSAANPPSAADKLAGKKDEEHISLFWRVFGGTILSIVALAAITLYNNLSSNIADIRNELNREREARAELIKKDEFNSRVSSQYERMRSFEGLKADLEGLKERTNANAAALDGLKKDSAAALDSVRKELSTAADFSKKDAAALEVLKDRFAGLEGLKKDVAGIDLLRERMTTATADLKAMRDELAKLRQEAEKNQAADLERKISRDAQMKQLDESFKDLQKGVQACREKLARLEGAKPAGKPNPAGPANPGADKPDPDGGEE